MTDEKITKSSDTEKTNRIPPGQRETKDWPVLHAGQAPSIDTGKWEFEVSGLVKEPKIFSYEEFINLPKGKVLADIHCVTTWSRLDNLWEGISSKTIVDIAQMLPEAKFVMVHSVGGYSTNLSMDDFLQEDVLFAFKHDDKELDPKHGYPLRLVVPKLYFWKSAKWVTGVEFIAEDKPGFWESKGYHNHGDPWTEERYG